MSSRFAALFRSRLCLQRLFLGAFLVLQLSACGKDEVARLSALPEDATVLVLGDSLVAGTGAPREAAWPLQLEKLTGWLVINAGVPGDTSADARRRLEGLLQEYQPDAVILAIGGNDFLRNRPLEETRSNLEEMIRSSLLHTRHVALVAIPAKSVGAALIGTLADHELYAELAREHALSLVPAVVSSVLSQAELRSDRIHANAQGYTRIARGVEESLSQHGWQSP